MADNNEAPVNEEQKPTTSVSDEEFDLKLSVVKKEKERLESETKEAVEQKVPEEKTTTGSGLIDHMIELAKRTSGYNYISVSRIEQVPESNKDKDSQNKKTTSLLLQQMLIGFMLRRGKNIEDFKKLFVHNEVVFFQAHTELPTLADDGLYSSYDPDGNRIKSLTSLDRRMITSPETFEPFILVKNGVDKDGKPQYGIIKGNPYHTFTQDEQVAAIKSTVKPE